MQVAQHESHAEDPDHHALHVEAAAAEPALAARDEEGADRSLALLELGDPVALGLDRAEVLVAERGALLHLHAAGVGMQVGAADRRAVDLQQDVARLLDLGLRHLLDAHVMWAVEDHGLHRAMPPTDIAS